MSVCLVPWTQKVSVWQKVLPENVSMHLFKGCTVGFAKNQPVWQKAISGKNCIEIFFHRNDFARPVELVGVCSMGSVL